MHANNLRLRKEWRTLYPICGLTILAMLLERAVLNRNLLESFEIMTMAAGCAFMGAGIFAEEFQDRTMSLLLSHPVPRRDIWFEKLKVLAAALGIVYAVFLVCLGVVPGTLALGSIPVIILFTGPGHGIAARSTFLGALNIFATPFAVWLVMLLGYSLVLWIYPAGGIALAAAFEKHPEPFVLIPAITYCAVAYRISYRGFLNLELIDSNVGGPEVKLPARLDRAMGDAIKRIIPGYTGTLSSLFRKELRLQKPAYVLAGFLCAAGALEMIVGIIHPSEIVKGILLVNPVLCVVVIPIVAAGMAVAEERGLGMIAWQRSLPPSVGTQWLVKFLIVFGTCAFLGVLLPAVMINVWYPVTHGTLAIPIPHDSESMFVALDVICGFLLFVSLTLFASSASTSSLRAILLALFLLMVTGTCAVWPVASVSEMPSEGPRHLVGEMYLYGSPWVIIPMLLFALLLSYRNFRRIEVTGRRLVGQSVLLLMPVGFWGLCLYGIRQLAEQPPIQ